MSTDAPSPDAPDDEPSDELAAKIFDYYEGTLPVEQRAEVEAYLTARGEPLSPAGDSETRLVLGALRKEAAPDAFTEGVADTIHRRSAGRFFGRRTLGDRVPFGWVLVLALVVLVTLWVVLWRSPTGSLDLRSPPPTPSAPGGGADLAPTP
ncbi:MAG: hypothetical protein R2939_01775 [Kofleriaceae bacterium]